MESIMIFLVKPNSKIIKLKSHIQKRFNNLFNNLLLTDITRNLVNVIR